MNANAKNSSSTVEVHLTSDEYRLIRTFRKTIAKFKDDQRPLNALLQVEMEPTRMRSKIIPRDSDQWID